MSILSKRLAEKAWEEHVCPEPQAQLSVHAGEKLRVEIEAVIPSGRVLVDRRVYERCVKAEKMLHALEAAGVDNWEGYEFALAMRNQP